MTKKHFIELANIVREHNIYAENDRGIGVLGTVPVFTKTHLAVLADFCRSQNPRFDRSRWLGYIAGENGPNGGKVKA